jgi:acyl carrier protein
MSLMWGFWEPRGSGMTAHLGRADLMRLRRQGVLPLSLELGFELLDAALSRPEAVLIPLRLDVGVMQRRLGEGGAEVPALYRVLLRAGLKRASAASGDTSALRGQLAALASEGERLKALVELVREDIAAVLALPGASSVRADVPLKELGLDSLMAVELRNRLSARVGTKLPTTLAFDYPTPTAMAQLLLEKLELGRGLVRVERRRAVDAATAASEAIAIVGMSCRAPRALTSPESYWALLESGGDGVGPLPRRWSREVLRRLRFCRRGGGIRRGVLWHLAARGARDGPAAAVDPGSSVGGAGACGSTTRDAEWKSHGYVCRLSWGGLRSRYALAFGAVDVERNGSGVERAGGTGLVLSGAPGSSDDG